MELCARRWHRKTHSATVRVVVAGYLSRFVLTGNGIARRKVEYTETFISEQPKMACAVRCAGDPTESEVRQQRRRL
jgi:hypothetical protein